MSRHISIGGLHAALIADRHQRRAVVRLWTEPSDKRTGEWLLCDMRPLRLLVGREVPADALP